MSPDENMAFDSIFFERGSMQNAVFLRFYSWTENSYTCGLSQKAVDFSEILPKGARIYKRPTGGGLVFHKASDITYALAIPASHKFFKIRPKYSYKILHDKIRQTLLKFDIKGGLLEKSQNANSAPAQCFVYASEGDILDGNLKKIAGAAQRRTRQGALIQGSIKLNCPAKISEIEANLAKAFAEILEENLEFSDCDFSKDKNFANAKARFEAMTV